VSLRFTQRVLILGMAHSLGITLEIKNVTKFSLHTTELVTSSNLGSHENLIFQENLTPRPVGGGVNYPKEYSLYSLYLHKYPVYISKKN
jgi:hypothetical protein